MEGLDLRTNLSSRAFTFYIAHHVIFNPKVQPHSFILIEVSCMQLYGMKIAENVLLSNMSHVVNM